MRTGPGFVLRRSEARLHAGGGEPASGASFSVTQFGAAVAGGGFVTRARAGRCGYSLQARGNVGEERGNGQSDTSDQSQQQRLNSNAIPTREERNGRRKLRVHD